jgi:hypothetical protein
MTPLTSMKGRHKAGQLQSSEGLRIPNLAQICQRQHPGKQPRAFGQCSPFYLTMSFKRSARALDYSSMERGRFGSSDLRAMSAITAISAIPVPVFRPLPFFSASPR